MLYTITKQVEICTNINIEISKVDHCAWIFTSRIFRLAIEIIFLLNKYFSYKWLTSYSQKVENLISGEVLIRALGGVGGGGWKKF